MWTRIKKKYVNKWKLQQCASWGVNAYGAHKIVQRRNKRDWQHRLSTNNNNKNWRTVFRSTITMYMVNCTHTAIVTRKSSFQMNSLHKNTNPIFDKLIDFPFEQRSNELWFSFCVHSFRSEWARMALEKFNCIEIESNRIQFDLFIIFDAQF